MEDFIATLHLEELIVKAGIITKNETNFEKIYSDIYHTKNLPVIKEIEEAIYQYFDEMQIPDTPTIYDEIILSLREKDLIVSFNWDLLLMQAYIRTPGVRPQLTFLHGNTSLSICYSHKNVDYKGYKRECPKCKLPMETSRLLYPIEDKNYTDNLFIKSQWEQTLHFLKQAYLVTIFGYSAPSADKGAVKLFRDAWQENPTMELADFEIIEKQGVDKEVVRLKWREFMVSSHHRGVYDDYKNTWLLNYPRRSCEALWEASCQQRPRKENPMPRFSTLKELHTWSAGVDLL
jgi:hypothetical protein